MSGASPSRVVLNRLGRVRRATLRLSLKLPPRPSRLRARLVASAAWLRNGVVGLVAATGLIGFARSFKASLAAIVSPFIPGWARRAALRTGRLLSRAGAQFGARLRALPSRMAGHFYRLMHGVVQRQSKLVSRFAKPLADPLWRFVSSKVPVWYLDAATGLERRLPRMFVRPMFAIAQYVHITALGIQLASGQTERALKLARTLNLMSRYAVRGRLRPACHIYFEALFRTMRFDKIVNEVPVPEIIEDHYLNHEVGVAHLYALNAETSIYFLQRAIAINNSSHIDHRMLGRALLLQRQTGRAAAAFQRSVALAPRTVMAHQNYAGRYDVATYEPKPFELARAGELLVYDNLGQFAEDLFLQGRFHESFRSYQRMLDYQKTLAPRGALPRALVDRVAALDQTFDRDLPIRLLPYEWVVQFGHIGLLDIYRKMAKLGMYPAANYVVLAPKDKVANTELLAYFDPHFTIVRDTALVDDLFPYQRYIGDNFMAYPADAGEAEPWTRAGARAQIAWAKDNRPPLLTLKPDDDAMGRERLAALGVPDGAWYVGLHVREGGFYQEASSGMSTHRNASIEDYFPAIAEITSHGGFVIRLGDKSMRPLTPMPGVIDYAVSAQKSSAMDIFLLATSRFVIGTTSGLTTACLAFGRPMLLVNCISNDWQLWTEQTDFIPKRLRDRRTGRYLTLGETYQQPVQGYLINNVVTNRRGYVIEPNTADEIAEAVRYKLDRLDRGLSRPDAAAAALISYGREMASNPMMFGAAVPVIPFLERHASTLFAPPGRFETAA